MERFGEREAVVDVAGGRRLTYAEFDAEVERVARGLLALGIDKGERVGIWAPNCVEWMLVQYATARIGAILVNINPAYRTHEVGYVLRQAGIRTLVSAPSFKASDYRAMIEEVRADLPALRDVVYIGEPTWEELLAGGSSVDAESVRARSASLDFDDPINIQYTSGTTGFPKGATLSHHNILNNGYFVGEICAYTEEDRICVPVPFYHCFGMVMGNLALDDRTVPASSSRRPASTPPRRCSAVQDERCTSLYGVPTMFIAELALPDVRRVRPHVAADRASWRARRARSRS